MTVKNNEEKKVKYIHLSEKDLNRSLWFSQIFLLILALFLSKIFFSEWFFIKPMLQWDLYEVFIYGGLSGLFIVVIQIILSKILPKTWMEDDGLNERLFENKPFYKVFLWTFMIAVIEEFLFRGVIQTKFGFWIAVCIFTLVHVRYLKKFGLLMILIGVSMIFGWLFQMTGNLWVTIFAHFIVDFLLVLYMKREGKIRRESYVSKAKS